MVKVSVVIPVYNAEDFIEESLDCILNQTLDDLEVICVDDGSEDNSLEILNEIASRDSRVKVFHQENQGGGAARNNALKHVTGEYLYFMDADDKVETYAFEDFYALSTKHDLDFLIFKATNYAEDTREYFETPYYNMDRIRDFARDNKVFSFENLGDLIFNISVTPWCKFYNTKFVLESGAQFLEGSIFHDNQFFWEVLFNAERMYFIDKSYYIRRRHSASSTGAGDLRYINIINVVNNIIKLFVKYDQIDRFRQILYNKKVLWITTRFFEIRDEFKDDFYREMKNDFSDVGDDFISYLDDKNRFLFNAVLSSKTARHFDLMCKNYDLKKENARLKNQKKLPNFLKYKLKKHVK